MSEYRIHKDINLFEIADEYAKRLQEHVDELALDMAAETLAKYGYVKVVRCRDCARKDYCCFIYECDYDPNGFCAWGKRKEAENGI